MSETDAPHPLLDEIEDCLARDGATDASLHDVLDRVLRHFGGAVGTIHRLDPSSGLLQLRAQRGLPEMLLPRTQLIPIGKGMAGLAAERRQPVQVCNLQADTCGVAKPGARETRMEGSIAVPMLVADRLHGVLGVGKPVIHEFSAEETVLLSEIAGRIGKFLG
jgi:putative methionine-R-sulfoxide reductase with GAF domain